MQGKRPICCAITPASAWCFEAAEILIPVMSLKKEMDAFSSYSVHSVTLQSEHSLPSTLPGLLPLIFLTVLILFNNPTMSTAHAHLEIIFHPSKLST